MDFKTYVRFGNKCLGGSGTVGLEGVFGIQHHGLDWEMVRLEWLALVRSGMVGLRSQGWTGWANF